jgi:hypothetical protein
MSIWRKSYDEGVNFWRPEDLSRLVMMSSGAMMETPALFYGSLLKYTLWTFGSTFDGFLVMAWKLA